jgi:exodeoxyribonuclease VII small subunit
MKYTKALAELESIVRSLETNTADVDTLSVQVKRAVDLVKFCKDKLDSTEIEIRSILKDLAGEQEANT